MVILLCAVCNAKVYAEISTQTEVQTTKTILVLGDSLTAAYNMAANEGWVNLLQQKLASANAGYTVVNASVSGATTAAGLSIMGQSLVLLKPTIVILALGANDGLQGKPISYITNNLDRLITQAQQANATVMLVGIRLPPNFGLRYTEPFFRQYSALANKRNIALLPFLLEGVAGNATLMQADGLHPNTTAQPILLGNIWPVLQPLL